MIGEFGRMARRGTLREIRGARDEHERNGFQQARDGGIGR